MMSRDKVTHTGKPSGMNAIMTEIVFTYLRVIIVILQVYNSAAVIFDV
jgi:hypothetical protein